jgi:uncharacterized protein YuzE
MQIEYDKKADALYLSVSDTEIAETKSVSEYCNVDLDREGKIVGIELLFVSRTGVLQQEELSHPIQIKMAS